MSFTQFSDGGALPAKIRLVGSWQFLGENHTGELVGELTRDTGEVFLEIIANVRWMDGIFLDNDHFVAGYTDLGAGCTARVSGKRIS